MILDEEMEDSSLQSELPPRDDNIPSPNDGIASNRSNGQDDENKSDMYFIAKVTSFLLFHAEFFLLHCALHEFNDLSRF